MWILKKPTLDVAKNDFDFAFPIGSDNDIDKDRDNIKKIYDLYDENCGCIIKEYEGLDCEHNTIGKVKKAYRLTYEGKNLDYIRSSLFKNVHKCPMCSISAPSELDHFLPISDYNLLSINRQNIVPACHICNNKKQAQNPNNFVHSYYAEFPNEYFFIAIVDIINDSLVVEFQLLEEKFENNELYKKALNQIKKIGLNNRLSHEIDGFLFEIFQAENLNNGNYIDSINRMIRKYNEIYGKNDWRTAFLIGIKNNKSIDSELINSIIARYRPNLVGA